MTIPFTVSATLVPWLVSPLLLWALQRGWYDLFQAEKAKRALEDAVLKRAVADPGARAAVVEAANHGTHVDAASTVVHESVRALDIEDASVVSRTLDRSQRHGSATYVLSIARHVSAKLAQTT